MTHLDQSSVDFCPSERQKLYKDGYRPHRPVSIFLNCQIIQRKQPWRKNFVSPFQWIPVSSFLKISKILIHADPLPLPETGWNQFEPIWTAWYLSCYISNSNKFDIHLKLYASQKDIKSFDRLTVKQFKTYLDVVIRFPSFNWIECEWQIWSQVSPLPGRPITNRRWHFWRTAWTLRPVRLWTGTFTNN